MNRLFFRGTIWVGALGWLLTGIGQAQSSDADRLLDCCYLSVGGGVLDFEGDEAVDDSAFIALRFGYDLSENWSTEIGLDVLPHLSDSIRTDWDTGERISRLDEQAGVRHTASMRLNLDFLRHFTRESKFDPYLAAGVGVAWYEDTFDKEYEGFAQTGLGCFLHLTESWALRADARAIMAGRDTEFNSTYSLGLAFRPGRHPAVDRSPTPLLDSALPPLDSDGDGLSDADESLHGTDPKKVDSDWDALTDGDEIHLYKTDPLKRDTDGGGVYDGHEVIEDRTDPLKPGDDLQFFELRMTFDPDDWKIKSEYFSEIGVIGKILRDDPSATARIEGHLDSKSHPSTRRAQALSKRRAQAVKDALNADWNIAGKRMTAVGYGLTRPKGPSLPEVGNPANERIEIYIRRSTPWRTTD